MLSTSHSIQSVIVRYSKMYEEVFKTFDSISTLTFLICFSILYLLSTAILHCLLAQCSGRYQALGSARQSYILCKFLEVKLFIFFCYMAAIALIREDINLFDTTNHRQNPQVMINMATAYGILYS